MGRAFVLHMAALPRRRKQKRKKDDNSNLVTSCELRAPPDNEDSIEHSHSSCYGLERSSSAQYAEDADRYEAGQASLRHWSTLSLVILGFLIGMVGFAAQEWYRVGLFAEPPISPHTLHYWSRQASGLRERRQTLETCARLSEMVSHPLDYKACKALLNIHDTDGDKGLSREEFEVAHLHLKSLITPTIVVPFTSLRVPRSLYLALVIATLAVFATGGFFLFLRFQPCSCPLCNGTYRKTRRLGAEHLVRSGSRLDLGRVRMREVVDMLSNMCL